MINPDRPPGHHAAVSSTALRFMDPQARAHQNGVLRSVRTSGRTGADGIRRGILDLATLREAPRGFHWRTGFRALVAKCSRCGD